jgi:DNA-binding response OmpR family regulator
LALNIEDELTFFIRKPFSIEQLAASVRASLDWRPARRKKPDDV